MCGLLSYFRRTRALEGLVPQETRPCGRSNLVFSDSNEAFNIESEAVKSTLLVPRPNQYEHPDEVRRAAAILSGATSSLLLWVFHRSSLCAPADLELLETESGPLNA